MNKKLIRAKLFFLILILFQLTGCWDRVSGPSIKNISGSEINLVVTYTSGKPSEHIIRDNEILVLTDRYKEIREVELTNDLGLVSVIDRKTLVNMLEDKPKKIFLITRPIAVSIENFNG